MAFALRVNRLLITAPEFCDHPTNAAVPGVVSPSILRPLRSYGHNAKEIQESACKCQVLLLLIIPHKRIKKLEVEKSQFVYSEFSWICPPHFSITATTPACFWCTSHSEQKLLTSSGFCHLFPKYTFELAFSFSWHMNRGSFQRPLLEVHSLIMN